MPKCDFCNQDVRAVGGVILLSPEAMQSPNDDTQPLAVGGACRDCLGIIAQTFDHWRNGGILNFLTKVRQGALLRTLRN